MGKRRQRQRRRATDAPPPAEGSTGAGTLERELSRLTPEQAEMFARALELAMKKRRLMLVGHVAALVGLIGSFLAAAIIWLKREPGTFIGWVFLIPFALAGVTLLGFGRLARRVKK